MHFDDRLGTVLRQPASGEAVARIQYVQLLDLLGTVRSDSDDARLDQAYERLLHLSRRIETPDRANLLRTSGLRLRNPRLLVFLAGDDPLISSAAIAAAEMDEEEWLDLIPALPIVSRGILRHRRDLGPTVEARLESLGIGDRGLPDAPQAVRSAGVVPIRAQAAPSETGIGEIVRKIEAYRKEHTARQAQPGPDAPRLPLGDGEYAVARAPLQSFDFVTDARGSIISADANAAPMLIGLALPSLDTHSQDASPLPLSRAFALRQPIERSLVTIQLAAPISGEWQIDAAPLFDDPTARFTGYAGRARRLPAGMATAPARDNSGDRMREMLHELRNPAGAIQMSSELIQQQLGGNVPHEYRAIAASIASDTALVLAGFEELDRLVRLDSQAMCLEPGEADIVAVVESTLAQINKHTEPRQSGFALDIAQGGIAVAMEHSELARLLWRLLAAIAGAAGAMEVLNLRLAREPGMASLTIALPETLRELSDADLYHAQAGDKSRILSAGMFGLGFTLRLARAEAGAAGGALHRENGHLVLTLPQVTQPSANVSEG